MILGVKGLKDGAGLGKSHQQQIILFNFGLSLSLFLLFYYGMIVFAEKIFRSVTKQTSVNLGAPNLHNPPSWISIFSKNSE